LPETGRGRRERIWPDPPAPARAEMPEKVPGLRPGVFFIDATLRRGLSFGGWLTGLTVDVRTG